MRVKQKVGVKGSLKFLQILINDYQNLIKDELSKKLKSVKKDDIEWVSPLKSDDFSEYRDNDFLDKLNLEKHIEKLELFWPKRGPQWDALAKTKNVNPKKIKYFIIEAKANIPEFVSPRCEASTESKKIIDKSLNDTKGYLNIKNDIDWSKEFYQYTNRVAHLYFLREKCGLNAYLLNIYFINDNSVNGPKTESEWKGAIQTAKIYLGLNRHKLSKYSIDIFINVNFIL